MNIAELTENFAIPGRLAFEDHDGLTRLQIVLPTATATIYLHGAHVTHWQPTLSAPVIYLSAQSDFAADKPIRGGVPICFPWFGPRSDGGQGPSHGFARIQPWTLAFAALAGDKLHLTFTLGPTDQSRALGFDHFRAAYEVIVGTSLTLRLTVANLGPEPLHFEEALHAYFSIGNVRQTTLTGLESAIFRDKTDAMREKHTPAAPLAFSAETDSVFPANTAAVTIHDTAGERLIHVEKFNSATTVVWNPWSELAAKLGDLPNDAWPNFVCVETANTATDAITLAPNQSHTMQCVITATARIS